MMPTFTNKCISAKEIIEFLKQKKLFVSDNNIPNAACRITNLGNTSDDSLVFIKKTSYDLRLIKSKILIVSENFKETSEEKTIIYSKDSQLAMAYIIKKFYLRQDKNTVSDTSYIHKSVNLGKNVKIGDNVHIGENCSVGDNTQIHPFCVIYPNTIIGNNVILYSGVKIGQPGFGYIKNMDGKYINFPHIGKVILCDNVEIGANTCIDGGSLSDTIIGENSKIDNLCHIAHNVQIGKNCLIIAKAEVSGSVSIGDDVYIGPSATIIDDISLGNNAVIGMGAIVRKDVQEGSTIVPMASFEKKTFVKLMSFLRKTLS